MNLIPSIQGVIPSTYLPTDIVQAQRPGTRLDDGQAIFDNGTHRIIVGRDCQIDVCNQVSGESYRIGGEQLQVELDDEHAFDFWGTTSFAFDDGTRLIVNTAPSNDVGDPARITRVTITCGDYGVRIGGLGSPEGLRIDESARHGRQLDRCTDDGNLLWENPDGPGFLGLDSDGLRHEVDQDHIDRTDITRGGAELHRMKEQLRQAIQALRSLIRINLTGALLSSVRTEVVQHQPDMGEAEEDVERRILIECELRAQELRVDPVAAAVQRTWDRP